MSDWNDVIIGKGQRGHTAIKVFEIEGDHGISDGGNCYWISDCILDTGMTIFKNCKEGEKLTQMIKDKVMPEKIQDWLNRLVLKHASPQKIINAIVEAEEEAYERGKEAKAAELRSVLLIREY